MTAIIPKLKDRRQMACLKEQIIMDLGGEGFNIQIRMIVLMSAVAMVATPVIVAKMIEAILANKEEKK